MFDAALYTGSKILIHLGLTEVIGGRGARAQGSDKCEDFPVGKSTGFTV